MSTTTEGHPKPTSSKKTIQLEGATVRLAGDSGDGMQLLGTQLTNTSALLGNDVATFPDFPAEIRAPRGTRAGVSGFQVQFSSQDIFTPGDRLDALVAMNPAALVTNVGDLVPGGILIVNEDGFDKRELRLANLEANPLEDGSLEEYPRLSRPHDHADAEGGRGSWGWVTRSPIVAETSSPWGWSIGCLIVIREPRCDSSGKVRQQAGYRPGQREGTCGPAGTMARRLRLSSVAIGSSPPNCLPGPTAT